MIDGVFFHYLTLKRRPQTRRRSLAEEVLLTLLWGDILTKESVWAALRRSKPLFLDSRRENNSAPSEEQVRETFVFRADLFL